jgi:DNA invertase Pin-like site-specific DNA recombinase
MNVVAYLRVSTTEQVDSGLGMDAQRTAVNDEATRRGWAVTWELDEGVSGKLRNRPGLDRALARLKAGEAQALVVAKMDRLGRSVIQASDVLETARRQKWDLIVLDLGMDLTTPHGKAMAQMLAVFAELEREMISARTRLALAEARSRGTRLGRPRQIDPQLLARIVNLQATGHSHRYIAAILTAEGVRTPTGLSRWHHGSITGYLASATLDPPTVAVESTSSTPRRRKKAS